MQRPRVICLAATLVASASMLALAPAAAQSALFPGELRPSVPGQSDLAALDQTGGQTSSQTGNNSTLFGPSLYGAPPSESGAGQFGFVSVGNRKVKVKLRPGGTPTAPVAGPGDAAGDAGPARHRGTAPEDPPQPPGIRARPDAGDGVAAADHRCRPISSSSRRSCRCASPCSISPRSHRSAFTPGRSICSRRSSSPGDGIRTRSTPPSPRAHRNICSRPS